MKIFVHEDKSMKKYPHIPRYQVCVYEDENYLAELNYHTLEEAQAKYNAIKKKVEKMMEMSGDAPMSEQHCGHECVCGFTEGTKSRESDIPCISIIYPIDKWRDVPCPHDTRRSRPAPCNQEIRGFVMIDRQKDFSLWLQQHDAAIRKNERETVLDEIIKLARCGKCPFPKKKVVVCESTNEFECIPCLANSLRSEEVRRNYG